MEPLCIAMTEDQRKENQRYYLECCRREGWLDQENQHLWPEDPEARAAMGRGLFGLAITNTLDSLFITWRERASNPNGRAEATPGSIVDLSDKAWRQGFASMSAEQREFVLRVVDAVLNSAAYRFAMTLDRFDHGNLHLGLTVLDSEQKPQFTVPIHPDKDWEMFQDILAWRDRFGRGPDIGRPAEYSI
jgi:hypothetical protein